VPTEEEIQAILNGPDRIQCVKLHANIKRSDCVVQQDRTIHWGSQRLCTSCQGCELGKEVKKELKKKKKEDPEVESDQEPLAAQPITPQVQEEPGPYTEESLAPVSRTEEERYDELIGVDHSVLTLELESWKEAINEGLEIASEANVRSVEHQAIYYILEGLKKEPAVIGAAQAAKEKELDG